MKYLVVWEFAPEDRDTVIEKNTKFREKREKDPEKFIKPIFPPHSLGADFPQLSEKSRGITIIEADEEEKLIEFVQTLMPEMRITLVPITPTDKNIKFYQKIKH